MAFSEEKVSRIFKNLEHNNWDFVKLPAEGSALDYLAQGKENLKIFLSFRDNWITAFQPFLPKTIVSNEDMLIASDNMHLLKYSVADDGHTFLSAEYPSEFCEAFYLDDLLNSFAAYNANYRLHKRIEADLEPLFPSKIIEEMLSKLRHEKVHIQEQMDMNSWRAVYLTAEKPFTIFISFTKNWVSLQAPIGFYPRAEETIHSAITSYLMELNHDLFWAKLSLCPALLQEQRINQINLSVEIPARTFSVPVLSEAIKTTVTYIERYYYEIRLITIEPELCHLLLGNSPDPTWFERPTKIVI